MYKFRLPASARASSAVLLIRVAGALMQMGLVAAVAILYSPTEVGLNGVMWSLAIVARMTGAAGLETVGLKLQVPLWSEGDRAGASALAVRDLRIVMKFWGVIFGLVVCTAVATELVVGRHGWWIIALGVVGATSSLHRLFVLQLQARERPILGQFMETVALPGLAIVGAVGAAAVNPEHLITTQVIAFIVVTILLFLFSPCHGRLSQYSTEPVLWRTALAISAGSLLTALTTRSPVFLLSMHSLAVAGTYDVAQRIQSAGDLGTSAVTTVYMSKIATSLQNVRALSRVITEAAALSLPIPLCLLLMLSILGREGMEKLLGEAYSATWAAAVILVASTVLNAITSAMSYVIILGERQRMYLFICAIQVVLVVGGALISGADSAVEMAIWVFVGEMLRSGLMFLGFRMHKSAVSPTAPPGEETS